LSGGEYLEVGWDDNLLEWAEEYLAKLLRRLNETRGQSEPKPGAACRWCPFADQCPLSQAPPRVLVNTWTGEVGTC
jgi:CRISPR/Cas system-associated exonuclease Cas4 (RecB family)